MTENILTKELTKERESFAYRDRQLPIDERVADLLSRMTIEEKVAQMLCIWGQKKTVMIDEEGKPDLRRLGKYLKDGVGQIARLSDTAGGLGVSAMAELANAVQKYFVEETRLGIPVIFHEECLHGVAAKEATSYPQPIGLASTFNPELVEEIYASIAEDMRRRGAHQALTPVVDVAREPRWGRVEETFGEDPYLVAQMGIAAVRGFQGDGRFKDNKHVIATLKHFAAHGQPESGTNCAPVNVSERLLRDTFLYTFREVIGKAGAMSVMASYNEIDGVPSHANRWLLREVLREEWKFRGYVVSDYYAITELDGKEDTQSHGVARDKQEAALLALNAGVNMELPDPDCYPSLVELVRSGRVDERSMDELVGPLLEAKFRLGLFDDPYVVAEPGENEKKLERDRETALRAAHETITLLKNEGGLLPLDAEKVGTLAVIGPNANRVLLGGYSGQPRYNSTVLEEIKNRVGSSKKVLHTEGCKITIGGGWWEDAVMLPSEEEDGKSIAEAAATARRADTVILVLGENEQTSREAWSKSHLGDRASLELFGRQNDLVRAIVETGKPVIAVLFNGRPNSIPYIKERAAAILECWYLGQEGGGAVADVLFGDYNPSGKLPISIPQSVGHIPCYYNHKPSARRGYLSDDVGALFPFGYGLSYTKFKIEDIRLDKPVIQSGESATVLVDVRNTGSREGAEVVQMYIHDAVSSVTRPVKELKGFRKVRLAPGESKTVSMTILPEHLAFTNIEKKFVVEAGDFEIMVGSSSRDEDLLTTILRVL